MCDNSGYDEWLKETLLPGNEFSLTDDEESNNYISMQVLDIFINALKFSGVCIAFVCIGVTNFFVDNFKFLLLGAVAIISAFGFFTASNPEHITISKDSDLEITEPTLLLQDDEMEQHTQQLGKESNNESHEYEFDDDVYSQEQIVLYGRR